jgi:hypothetical protein
MTNYKTGDRVFCPSYMISVPVQSTEVWGTVKVTPKAVWVVLDEPLKGSYKVRINTYPFRSKSKPSTTAKPSEVKKIDSYSEYEAKYKADLAEKQESIIADYQSRSDQRRVLFSQINDIKAGDIVTRIDCGLDQSYTITKIVDTDPWRSGLGQVGYKLFYGIDHRSKREYEVGGFIHDVIFVKG